MVWTLSQQVLCQLERERKSVTYELDVLVTFIDRVTRSKRVTDHVDGVRPGASSPREESQ